MAKKLFGKKSSIQSNTTEPRKTKKGMKIGTKLTLVSSLGLLITIAVIVVFVSVFNMNQLIDGFNDSCVYYMNGINNFKDDYMGECDRIATNMSESRDFSNAVNNLSKFIVEDTLLTYTSDGVTKIAVVAASGKTLAISDEAISPVLQMPCTASALGGVPSSFIEVIGNNVCTVSVKPVKAIQGENIVGAVAVIRYLNDEAALDELKDQSGAEYTVFLGNTRIATTVVQNGARQVGTTMSDAVYQQVIVNGQNYVGRAQVVGEDFVVQYAPLFNANNQVVGALFSGSSLVATYNQCYSTAIAAALIGLVMLVVVGVTLVIVIRKIIVAPLNRVVDFSQEVTGGNLGIAHDLDTVYKYSEHDEIGKVFQAELGMVNALRDYIAEIDHVLTDLSNGDLTTATVQDYKGDFISIRNSLRKVQERLIANMTEIHQAATILTTSANEIASSSQALAQGATEQAGSVEELNATIEDVFNNVKKTAEDAQEASKLTANVGTAIKQGNDKVHEMITAMDEISEASSKIEKIIKTIDDIAFQTNILALNAAVEAARAGAAGKGFAVVADEVRNLAGKSADAARDTTTLIQNSLKVVAEGSSKAGETAEVMDKIVTEVGTVVTTIGNISGANEEQAVALGQIQSGMAQIAQVVHTNSASAEESAATSEELEAQARLLEQLVSTFKIR